MKQKGFGDTVAYAMKVMGGDKVADTYTKVTGKDCGCKKRQAALNKAFPYKK